VLEVALDRVVAVTAAGLHELDVDLGRETGRQPELEVAAHRRELDVAVAAVDPRREVAAHRRRLERRVRRLDLDLAAWSDLAALGRAHHLAAMVESSRAAALELIEPPMVDASSPPRTTEIEPPIVGPGPRPPGHDQAMVSIETCPTRLESIPPPWSPSIFPRADDVKPPPEVGSKRSNRMTRPASASRATRVICTHAALVLAAVTRYPASRPGSA
jgi:hypothetical protein